MKSMNPDVVNLSQLLSPRQLADRWTLSEKTLERWRHRGTGPVYIKLGSNVRYRCEDVLEHESRRLRGRTRGAEA